MLQLGPTGVKLEPVIDTIVMLILINGCAVLEIREMAVLFPALMPLTT